MLRLKAIISLHHHLFYSIDTTHLECKFAGCGGHAGQSKFLVSQCRPRESGSEAFNVESRALEGPRLKSRVGSLCMQQFDGRDAEATELHLTMLSLSHSSPAIGALA
ncbi:hypothetical protein PoB_006765500 [Plakobranchus ocellatus]|uniref:Uncharacterized protein n=1 Tax=Plakobranchus ocellatus TaxID=259542 RepID=A0AAV4DAU2_9GAST|nr:hypothetical protein PoB_006765500 [Plakobranchus ocellatus]